MEFIGKIKYPAASSGVFVTLLILDSPQAAGNLPEGIKMAPYQQNGFLGDEIRGWIDKNREYHADLFNQAEQLNSDCYTALGEARPHRKDKRELLLSCLFPRAIELFQGIYLVISRGMIPTSNVMLRCLIETMFIIVAISKDDNALEAYILNDEAERLRTANKIIQDQSSIFSEIPVEEAQRIKTELQEKIQGSQVKKFNTEEFSKKAGLHDWYLTVYAVASQSVHSTVKDLEQYLDLDQSNNLKSIKFAPTDKGTVHILATACNALNASFHAFLTVFNSDISICTQHAAKIEPFMKMATTLKN